MPLSGRVAIVTGGAQGLGKEICLVLLNNKCKVCLTDVSEETARRTLEEFEGTFGKSNVIFKHCDVTDRDSFENVFLKTKEVFGKVDILIGNAGLADEENWERMVDVNLKANIIGYKLAEKHMIKNGDSKNSVIFVASVAGLIPAPELPLYSATKAALIALTRSWGNAAVSENSGIAVNAVCPSGMRTQLSITVGKQMKLMKTFPANAKGYFGNVEMKDVTAVVEKLLEENTNGAVVSITDKLGVKHIDHFRIA